jgi:hypothetical protein
MLWRDQTDHPDTLARQPARPAVPDSWDEEDDGNPAVAATVRPGSWDDEEDDEDPAAVSTAVAASTPPVRKSSQTYENSFEVPKSTPSLLSPLPPSKASPNQRAATTDAVARRLIAGALGVKPPPRTPEQREYERAVRAAEERRRVEAREKEQRLTEKRAEMSRAMWED